MSKKTNKDAEKSFQEHLKLYKTREWIKEPYKDSPSWCEKVDKMPAKQVYAIYNSFVKSIKKKTDVKLIEQLTIFDCLD